MRRSSAPGRVKQGWAKYRLRRLCNCRVLAFARINSACPSNVQSVVMQKYNILLKGKGITYECSGEQHLVEGMTRQGKKGIQAGCAGGGCGVCKVRILDGQYRSMKMSRAHVSEEEEKEGYALACRCRPDSDIVLEVVGQIKKAIPGYLNL